MKLAVVLVVLGLVASSQALECYACRSDEHEWLAGSVLRVALTHGLDNYPPCSEFDSSEPDDRNKRFVQVCRTDDRSCMKVADMNDSNKQFRGCFLLPTGHTGNKSCNDDGSLLQCYCGEDLCNGSGRGFPFAVLLVTTVSLVAALLGGL